MSILFINGSPNKNGNTAELAKTLMNGKEYETLELVDYKVYGYGQHYKDDQFDLIVHKHIISDNHPYCGRKWRCPDYGSNGRCKGAWGQYTSNPYQGETNWILPGVLWVRRKRCLCTEGGIRIGSILVIIVFGFLVR